MLFKNFGRKFPAGYLLPKKLKEFLPIPGFTPGFIQSITQPGPSIPVGGQGVQNLSPPIITGLAQETQTLTTSDGTWSGEPTQFSYQWFSNATPVGSNQNTYVIQNSDIGNHISVIVTASSIIGQSSSLSNSTPPIVSIITQTLPIIFLDLDFTKAFPRLI